MIGLGEAGDERGAAAASSAMSILTTVNPDGIIDLTIDQADAAGTWASTSSRSSSPSTARGCASSAAAREGPATWTPETGTHVVYGYAGDLERGAALGTGLVRPLDQQAGPGQGHLRVPQGLPAQARVGALMDPMPDRSQLVLAGIVLLVGVVVVFWWRASARSSSTGTSRSKVALTLPACPISIPPSRCG